jgi:lipoate-protein ligase A
MGMICRVLPYDEADGPAHMACDEALLDAAAADPSAASFRTYGWSVPTLSLGYFQRYAEVEADPRWRDGAVVRRPTGGGAIWHHHELTYALVIPRGHPLARHAGELYRVVHGELALVLRSAGVDARLRGLLREEIRKNRPFLCFTDPHAVDILVAGAKVVGSSQRRRTGSVLQHGSLLVTRSPTTPHLPGVADLAQAPADVRFWSDLLQNRIPVALGFRPQVHPITRAERARAEVLAREVYRSVSWNRRR